MKAHHPTLQVVHRSAMRLEYPHLNMPCGGQNSEMASNNPHPCIFSLLLSVGTTCEYDSTPVKDDYPELALTYLDESFKVGL